MPEIAFNDELHISIDMESLAAKHTCPALLSIGVVAFNPNIVQTPEELAQNPTFHLRIQPKGQGRVVEPETLDWWQQQAGPARDLLDECAASSVTLHQAMRELSDWLEGLRQACRVDEKAPAPKVHAWSYGAKSDLVWWATACEHTGIPYPIGYRNEHCLRTLAGELPEVKRVTYGVTHDALADAIAQAAWIQQLRGALAAMKPRNLT